MTAQATPKDVILAYSQETSRPKLRGQLVATIRAAQEGNATHPAIDAALRLIEEAEQGPASTYQSTLRIARQTAAGFCDAHNIARAPHLSDWHLGRAALRAAADTMDAPVFRESLANLAAYLRGPEYYDDFPSRKWQENADAADARIVAIIKSLE